MSKVVVGGPKGGKGRDWRGDHRSWVEDSSQLTANPVTPTADKKSAPLTIRSSFGPQHLGKWQGKMGKNVPIFPMHHVRRAWLFSLPVVWAPSVYDVLDVAAFELALFGDEACIRRRLIGQDYVCGVVPVCSRTLWNS